LYATGSNDGYAVTENLDTLLIASRYYEGPVFNGALYKMSEQSGALLDSNFYYVASDAGMNCSLADIL